MQLASAPYVHIPVVSPFSADPSTSGKIRYLPCGGGLQNSQLEAIRDDRGEVLGFEVRAAARRRGWIMLQDLYEAEGRKDDWILFKRHMDLSFAGKTKVSFPRDRLPAEVLRRQMAAVPDEFAELLADKPFAIVPEPDPKPAVERKVKPAAEGRA